MSQFIDLLGNMGNAYSLLGLANRWGKQLDLDTKEIQNDMMSGDYDHLLDVFEKHFSGLFEWNRDELEDY